MNARALPVFTSFTQDPSAPDRAAGEVRRWSYRVDAVRSVVGTPPPGVGPGPLWRLEAAGRLPVPDAPFVGATTHAVYASTAIGAELAPISARESGPRAVLIPIRKNAEWWALGPERRQAFVVEGDGHLAIGRRYAGRIYRRLYRARYLPGSSWDFLTYFEFPASESGAFQSLLGELRDTGRNPEWAFVDGETEIWMTQL